MIYTIQKSEEASGHRLFTTGELRAKSQRMVRLVERKYPDELAAGIEVEKEHSSDPETAKVIAVAHILEDPQYYVKLAEAGLVDEPKARNMLAIRIEKSATGHGLVPIKKNTSDGRVITYWTRPGNAHRSERSEPPATSEPIMVSLPDNSKAKAAEEELRSTLYQNPLIPSEVGFGFKAKDGSDGVAMVDAYAFDGALHVGWLQAFPKGEGAGTELLKKVMAIAEKHGVPVSLEPDKTRGQAKRLEKYYLRMGFKKGRYGSLTWTPLVTKSIRIIIEKSLTWSGFKLQGRKKVQGMDISIENKKGSVRRGVDKDGHEWATKMKYDYGYCRQSEGVDGDFFDCYLGPDLKSKKVFVVNQNDPTTGAFDEQKAMIGFESAEDAKKAYLSQYDRPGFFGDMVEVDIEAFKRLIMSEKWKGKKIPFEKVG